MSPVRARFVTVCQQLLALGVVVVAMAPATRVVSLDVVGIRPGANGVPSVEQPRVALSSYDAARAIRKAERRLEARGHALRRGDRVEAGRVSP
jgi:hypothetical protein